MMAKVRCWYLAVLAIAGAETTFERAVFLVGESQARCTGAEVDLLHARTHVAGFASGVHSVMAALSSALLSGRVLAVQTPKACGSGHGLHGHDYDIACAFQERAPFLPLSPCAFDPKRRSAKASASRFQLGAAAFNASKHASPSVQRRECSFARF